MHRFHKRLAIIERVDHREILGSRLEPTPHFSQDLLTLGRRSFGPGGKGCRCRLDGAHSIFGIA